MTHTILPDWCSSAGTHWTKSIEHAQQFLHLMGSLVVKGRARSSNHRMAVLVLMVSSMRRDLAPDQLPAGRRLYTELQRAQC